MAIGSPFRSFNDGSLSGYEGETRTSSSDDGKRLTVAYVSRPSLSLERNLPREALFPVSAGRVYDGGQKMTQIARKYNIIIVLAGASCLCVLLLPFATGSLYVPMYREYGVGAPLSLLHSDIRHTSDGSIQQRKRKEGFP